MVKIIKRKVSIRIILLLIPFIFFAISASLLYFNRFQSYPAYERVQFNSAGSTLYANLHYPSKNLPFQEKHPLVIYAHGSGWQKDVDTRVALELTKRGFFVASIDYHGHGESQGEILDTDPDTGVLALAQDCSKLLDAIENLEVYAERINASQIGLVGHSLGGLVVLMNGALDTRFTATISWAGVVNMTLGTGMDEYNPVNLLNSTNPRNLLLIHGYEDSTVDYEDHALVAQELTGCTIINITDSIISDHYLISDIVLFETINWFETVFFGSETINGPITLTFVITLTLMVLTFVGMCLTVLSLMIYSSKYILQKPPKLQMTIKERSKKKRILEFIITLLAYIVFWVITVSLVGLSAIYINSIIIILGYYIYKIGLAVSRRKKGVEKESLLNQKSPKFELRNVLYSVYSAFIFLGFYYLIAFTIPWAVFYPPDITVFLFALLIVPFYFASEIFYRKILFPLSNFIKSRKLRTLLLSIIILFMHLYFVILSFLYYGYPAFMAAFFASLMASIMNCIIYHKTGKMSGVLINSTIINIMFFGATSPALLAILFGFTTII